MTINAFGKALEQWKNSAVMVLIGAVVAGGLLTAISKPNYHTSSSNISILLYAVIAYISLYLMKKKWLDVRTVSRVSELTADSTLYIMERKDSAISLCRFGE